MSINKPLLIYVAGPLSGQDGSIGKLSNVVRAVEMGEQIYHKGHFTYIPHLTVFQHKIIRRLYPDYKPTYDRWLKHDFEILSRCDALFRIDGDSKGADKEVVEAIRLNKPVYYSLDDIPSSI